MIDGKPVIIGLNAYIWLRGSNLGCLRIDMLTARSKKKGIKVIPTWQVGETDNFTSLDAEQDPDIEPAPQDDRDTEVKQESE